MTHEYFQFDELRKTWISMGECLGMPAPDNDPEDLNKKKTALDRLRTSYGRFRTLALLFAVTSLLIFSNRHLVDTDMGLYLGIAYAVYFLINATMDWWLWRGVGTIDPLTMGAAQVSEKALFYRKRHLQMIAFVAPLAILILGLTAYVFRAEKYLLLGMVAGFVCGLTIGLHHLRKFMENYKRLAE